MIQLDINTFMDPWTGLADDDEVVAYYYSMGKLSDEQYKKIIKSELVPYYSAFNREVRIQLRRKLAQSLENPNYNFEREFNSALPPFRAPEDPRQFFVWIYEELQTIDDG